MSISLQYCAFDTSGNFNKAPVHIAGGIIVGVHTKTLLATKMSYLSKPQSVLSREVGSK